MELYIKQGKIDKEEGQITVDSLKLALQDSL